MSTNPTCVGPLKRSDKSVNELSKKRDLKRLNEWLAGTRKPTRSQLEAFARATCTPFGYLVLSEPPHESPSSIPHFGTVKSNQPIRRSINFEDAIQVVEQRQDWVCDYLADIGAEPLEFVGTGSVDDDPADTANRIRAALKLTQDWTADCTRWEFAQRKLENQMEDAGIFLSVSSMVQHNTRRRLNPEEFRGFVLVDDYAPIVFVNGGDIAGARLLTLAHGLAHVWIGQSASFDLRRLAPDPKSNLELACSRVAAEFLVPTTELLQNWGRFEEFPGGPFKAISRHFKVSNIIAVRRALDTSLISQKEFDGLYDMYVRLVPGWRRDPNERQSKQKGSSFHIAAASRIGRRFMKNVIVAVGESELLYHNAYHLTGLKSETFDKVKDLIENEIR